MLAAVSAVEEHARSNGVSILVEDAGAGLRKTVPPGDEVRQSQPSTAYRENLILAILVKTNHLQSLRDAAFGCRRHALNAQSTMQL